MRARFDSLSLGAERMLTAYELIPGGNFLDWKNWNYARGRANNKFEYRPATKRILRPMREIPFRPAGFKGELSFRVAKSILYRIARKG